MTAANILRSSVLVLAGLAAGWWLRSASQSRTTTVMGFREDAAVVQVKGRTYSFSELPIQMRHHIHSAYLQAHGQFRTVAEDFAARVVASGGKDVAEFTWEKEYGQKPSEEEVRKAYESGFRNVGPLSDAKVRAEVEHSLQRNLVMNRISKELSTLVQNKELKMMWDLPLAPELKLSVDAYPVVEVGDESDTQPLEVEVVFNYGQANSEGAFFAISRVADSLKRRIRIRLLSESTGLAKEEAATALVNCLAREAGFKREAWLVHARLTQELYRLPNEQSELPMAQYFPGDPELVKRVATCNPKPLEEKMLVANTAAWKPLRSNPYPMIFINGRRISDQDPRGTEGVLRELLGERGK